MGEDIWREQLEAVTAAQDGETFSILLTHRPERVEDYAGRGFDLVLAGHAHGGQWRLPGLINGLIAPNQGLFPRYAGGRYALDGDTTMIVSGGWPGRAPASPGSSTGRSWWWWTSCRRGLPEKTWRDSGIE